MPLDKEENYDKITLLNALMEQSAAVGCQREGMVRALSRDRSAGHSGAAREDRDGASTVTADDNEGSPSGDHQGGTVEDLLSPLNRVLDGTWFRGVFVGKGRRRK